MSTKSKTPSYKFYVEIKRSLKYKRPYSDSSQNKIEVQYYAVIKGRNHEVVFTGETRKRKSSLIKTINNLFHNVVIKDKTK